MSPSFRSLVRALTPRFIREFRVRSAQRVEAARHAAETRLHQALGGRVLSGPFAGMHYVAASWWGTLGPKILGTYEMELARVVEAIIAKPCRRFIDIGAAEGFYAVGLLTRLPAATGMAFEGSPEGRDLLRQMADANGVVDRLEIRGHCGPGDLASAIDTFRPDLVICDVEGAERELLDVETIPGIAAINLLVEVHDFVDPTLSATLLRRFSATHAVERIAARPRKAADVPTVPGFTRAERLLLAAEQRPPGMEWLWLQARR